jgi:NAD(P)-dependent dehydrogenase (short-subunit alcohol dehydrogenase family)
VTRRALITGGLSGIGRAAAERLATDGIEVITADVAPGADIALDVSDADAATAAVENLGQIDILVNSAGIVGPGKPLWATTAQEWHEVFAVNLHGSVNMCRAAIPGMLDRGWGRIVNLASMAGKDGNPHQSAYSASKAAVIGFTKSLGKELATTGVIVNAIAPAVIATDECQDRARHPGEHLEPDPDGPAGAARGGGRADRLAHLRQVQLLHRRRLRHQRRPRHLLSSATH